MARVIDRRTQGKSPSAPNRKKFLDRYKKYIKDAVDQTIERSKIKDIQKKRKVSVPADRMDEPTYVENDVTGVRRTVSTGNDRFSKGDKVPKPIGGGGNGGGGAGDSAGPDDAFEFVLTKSEFLDILFEDMSLPNYVKENLKNDFKTKRVRAGHTKEGVISQLNIKKTIESSLARRIAHRGSIRRKIDEALTEQEKNELKKKKVPFLEDVDLRYNLYQTIRYPVKSAVMFCLMDVSGSMGRDEKDLAKRFFLLLFLFLDREYDKVEIRFVRHAESAEEVTENEFFYGTRSGGTIVSTGFQTILDIIDEEYDHNIYNIYVAQAGDGDNFAADNS